MNLRRMLFWKPLRSGDTQASDRVNEPPGRGEGRTSNVVQLPDRTATHATGGEPPVAVETLAPSLQEAGPAGLLDAPEFKEFFATSFFGHGCHNGAHLRTQAARELGKAGIVARFQNVVARRVAALQADADRLRNMEIQIEGVCGSTSAQLRHARERLERDIGTLREQGELSAEGRGWVLAALNQYQIGFAKGLQEVVDGELLFR